MPVPTQPLPETPETERQPQKKRSTAKRANPTVENIETMGTTDLPTNKSNVHCLTIIGQVEGHVVLPPNNKTTKYEHIMPQLVAIEQNPEIEGTLIMLNTVGGDVEAGLAIAEMIASMSKPTVSIVLGGGHSIGVPIAVSANYSFIVESATMTIHPIRLTGLVIGVQQSFDYLEKMQDRISRFVLTHSKIKADKWRDLLYKTGELSRDIGTTVIGTEAVKYGLINEVGGLAQANAKLQELIRAHKGQGDLKQ